MKRIYYNENDRFAIAWLKQLIYFGAIPDGDIDERSIVEVTAADVAGYEQCHFFAGIGGWVYALDLAGWRGPVWTGSCPCQPFSVAGGQAGTSDKRHLWPELHRLARDARPPVLFGEQVASRLGREWLAGVRSDLEALGYAVGAADLCAAGVSAPHIRQRLYWVGHAHKERRDREHALLRAKQGNLSEATGHGVDGGLQFTEGDGRQQRRPEPRRRSIEPRCGDGGGLLYSPGARCDSARQEPEEEARHQTRLCGPEPGRSADLGLPNNNNNTGLEIIGVEPDGSERTPTERSNSGGFWGRGVFVPCLDGKARRVEPGIFPLADGFPNRVGTLRGSGNAIVPQVAAQFITAFMEATDEPAQ